MEELIGGIIGKEVMAPCNLVFHFSLTNEDKQTGTIVKLWVDLDFHEFTG